MTTPTQGPVYGSPYGAPSPSPYGTGLWQPPPSRGMAIAALVLSLLFFIPLIPLVVSVVLAIIVLSRGKDGRDHGRGMAIAALVVDGVVIVGSVAVVVLVYAVGGTFLDAGDAVRDQSGQVTDAGDVDTMDIRQGDCVNDSSLSGLEDGEQVEAAQQVKVVPCSQAHSFEVYHDFDLPDGDYPGQKPVTSAADKGCYDAFEGFVGRTPDRSELEVYYYFPQRQTWAAFDDRTVSCLLADPQGQVRGSLEDSRR